MPVDAVDSNEFQSKTFRRIIGKKSDFVESKASQELKMKNFLENLQEQDEKTKIDSTNYDTNQVVANKVKI